MFFTFYFIHLRISTIQRLRESQGREWASTRPWGPARQDIQGAFQHYVGTGLFGTIFVRFGIILEFWNTSRTRLYGGSFSQRLGTIFFQIL